MNKKTSKQRLSDITFISLFAALCYIALTVFFFPVGPMFMHFGNLIVVVAALLVGGWQGGLSGSVGMGLYDILNGHADSSPKTFLLKFLIGLTVGMIFNSLNKRKKYPTVILSVLSAVNLIIATVLAIPTQFSDKKAILTPLFIVVGLFCFVFSLLKTKFSKKTACAIVGATCGMLVNIAGETLWKIAEFTLAGSTFKAAVASALLAQGSTLINAGVAIIAGVALFSILEKPFEKITHSHQ